MTQYELINLNLMLKAVGEDTTRNILSSFSCPLNPDVENFLHNNAIDFAKRRISQTHLVMADQESRPVLVGYFTLANKIINVQDAKVNNRQKKKLEMFAHLDGEQGEYQLSALLIAQLGKNFADNNNQLITGDQLLQLACDKVRSIQRDVGGVFTYLECEDKPKLVEFYQRNGFTEFNHRNLEPDEEEMEGKYLLQMLKYIK